MSDTCGKEALKIVWNTVKASRMVTSDDDDAGHDEDDNDDDKITMRGYIKVSTF